MYMTTKPAGTRDSLPSLPREVRCCHVCRRLLQGKPACGHLLQPQQLWLPCCTGAMEAEFARLETETKNAFRAARRIARNQGAEDYNMAKLLGETRQDELSRALNSEHRAYVKATHTRLEASSRPVACISACKAGCQLCMHVSDACSMGAPRSHASGCAADQGSMAGSAWPVHAHAAMQTACN